MRIGKPHNTHSMTTHSGNDSTLPRWYALKVFFNRAPAIKDTLTAKGIECYLPTHTIAEERDGKILRKTRPLIASLLFFRTDSHTAIAVQSENTGKVMLYTRITPDGRIPAAIPDKEMEIFRLVTSSGAEGLEYLPDDSPRYHTGDKVRVTGGPFAGAEGHIARIRGDRRLVVSVRGVCAVATAYIPQCFIEPIT